MFIEKIRSVFQNKSVAIWGMGREGKSSFRLLKGLSVFGLALYDDHITDELKQLADGNARILKHKTEMNDYDIILKSPGIVALDSPEVIQTKLSSQTEIFLSIFRNQVIGITGTKGKSTTTTLIYHILKSIHANTVLVGNIGIPCFDLLDVIDNETKIVFELSCHQLQFAAQSPHIAILLNIYQDHLDHYKTLEKYIAAKENIFRHQRNGDMLISSAENTAQNDCAAHLPQKLIVFSENQNSDVSISGDILTTPDGTVEIRNEDTKLIGKHNRSNIAVAYYVCHDLYGIDNAAFKKALLTYEGLPHRLQKISVIDEVEYYDDSISTVPETAIAAIQSLGNVGTVIIGGMDRGINYHPLTDFLLSSNIDRIILLPDTSGRIHRQLRDKGCRIEIFCARDLADAVCYCKQNTARGKACLLSPAAASYGFYKNFEERGDHFKQLVTGE